MKNKIFKFANFLFKIVKNPRLFSAYFELYKISKIERYKKFDTKIFGKSIRAVDSNSFLSSYREIFENEIYKFRTENLYPLIIDCGANIGLSVIYFKKIFPNAKIIAFEPDAKIFEILKNNISSLELKDITIINKALSNKEGVVDFHAEGADGGRIAQPKDKKNITKIEATRLITHINQLVDFLKVDIEGAELDVIIDCKNYLKNVKNLFIEYHSFTNKQQELEKILDIIKKSDFRYYINNSGTLSRSPFINIAQNLSMDLQLNIFAYRN